MKKKMFCWLLLIAIVWSACVPVNAQEEHTSSVRTDFEDGSYCITTIVTTADSSYGAYAASSTKSGTKYKQYYNENNVLQFTFGVRGTFTYDGTKAKATSAQYSYQISNSSWSFVSGKASCTSATATAICTFSLPAGTIKTLSVSLTCSPTGVLS